MKNIKPCPYCGAEVEVVRMPDRGLEKTYRIQCKRCHALVARGLTFENESKEDGLERIRQYEAEQSRIFFRKDLENGN